MSPAHAEDGRTLGSRWSDGLDTRYAAQRLSQAFSSAGYSSSADLNGATAEEAWTRLQSAQAFASFTHANAGVLAVQSTAAEKQYLLGGIATDLASLVPNARYLAEFRPLLDVDDLKLAIFAGCLSANSSVTEGDLDDMAKRRGVDSVVTYAGKIEFPVTRAGSAPSDSNYSGNYYYSRVATYLAGGATIESALKRAITDLVAKEGSNASYNTYRISGSVAAPASVRLTSTRSGAMQGPSQAALGLLPFSFLNASSTRQYEVPAAGTVTEYTSSDDASSTVRYLSDGSLFDLVSTSSATGAVQWTADEAQHAAVKFAEQHVPQFDAAAWEVVERDTSLSRRDGELLASFTWRNSDDPHIVTAEIDRRSGAITYFSNTHAPQTTASGAVSATEAADIAAEYMGQSVDDVRTASAYRWDGPNWKITLDRGGPPMAALEASAPVQVVIDGVTGQVLRVVSG